MINNTFEPSVFELENPINVFCVTAESFPDDIMNAHKTLHKVAPADTARQYFGISWGGETITYKAAATEITESELASKGLEEFVIKEGPYLSILVNDFDQINDAIQQLITDPRIDPEGYCVEMYLDDSNVRCMVTVKE